LAQLIQLNNFLIKLKFFEKIFSGLNKISTFLFNKNQTNLPACRQEKRKKAITAIIANRFLKSMRVLVSSD
jgi:hypothetical protein